jgi:hypothetical protein
MQAQILGIQPRLLTLNELLNGRLFRIPEYQRSYSWDTKQRTELFSDIEKARSTDGQHFMATIVGLRRGTRNIRTNDFSVIEIVDGQQRLTTLIILLKAIEIALDRSEDLQNTVAQELEKLLVKADDVAPVLLQTNHDSSRYCLTYLREGSHPAVADAKTLADRYLLGAMVDCERYVQRWKASGSKLTDLIVLLKNRLNFIFHELADEAAVYLVFEVLNSRGLEVSWFDRLKSILMGIAFEAQTGNETETISEIHSIWHEIYDTVGLRQGLSTEALRFAATLRFSTQPSRPLGEEDAVDVLRTASDSTAKGAIDVSRWVLRVTQAADKLYADKRLTAVTAIVQARLLAVALQMREDLDIGERNSLLKDWEKVSFRIYGMCRKDARTKVGDYVRLAWRCVHDAPDAGELRAQIRALGSDHSAEAAADELRDANCYEEWQTELRYFLFRYEEHLARTKGQNFDNEQWSRIWEDSAARSIEHVLPQSRGSAWPTDDGIFVHRLGNLTLLPPGLNSRLQALDPVDKKGEYLKTGLAVASDVAQRIPPWDRKAIEKREEELIAWAADEWA